MASGDTLSIQHFLRYQREVFKRALFRWRSSKGQNGVLALVGGAISAFAESRLGSEPDWWHSPAAVGLGAAGVALLLYLIEVPRTRARMDLEKTERIQRLSGGLSEEGLVRSTDGRIRLYRQVLLVCREWGDLASLVERSEYEITRDQLHAADERLKALRREVDEASRLERSTDRWWYDRYSNDIDTVRRLLLGETDPRSAIDGLREPVRRLRKIAEEDRDWDISRRPTEPTNRP